MMKTKLLIPLLLLLSAGVAAQTTRKEMFRDINRTGANYFVYPGPSQKALTPAPEGYEPFYISHYGRHGSRYMEDNGHYTFAIWALDTAAQLGILKPKGAEVLGILQKGYADAFNRDGDLTALGGRQHQEIARRMYDRFPSLLSQPLKADARSSTAGRCMISMFYFCQELQGLNPSMSIRMNASNRDMRFVVGNRRVRPEETPAMAGLEKQAEKLFSKAVDVSRLMKTLFTDVSRARSFIDVDSFLECLYNVSSDLQNLPELNLSLTDLFTKEELFGAWKACNAAILLECGLIPGSTPAYLQQMEVRDSIVSIADRVIRTGEPALTLRFSHDGSVLPLAYLMGLKEAMGGTTDLENLHKHISIDKLIPMAANIQLVFYRKAGSDDVLVKFLLNENETSVPVETDCAPYYHWQDVKRYWNHQDM
ncbi:MAG: histidine-type phosphatase [Bacteroidales bacterium]|nr:histidine-type phosphatase [Bacteroidales bacterium]